MKIRITGQSGESIFPFEASGPWQAFKKEIVEQGHTIALGGIELLTDALISHTHSKAYLKEAKRNHVPISKRILVIWEPRIAKSKNYSKRVLKQYGKIYSPSPIWASGVKGNEFKWPQDEVKEIENFENWSNRQDKFVIIQANKFSSIDGELYSLRRKVLLELSPHIHLFGKNWNQGALKDFWVWMKSAIRSFPSRISLKTLYGLGKVQKSFQGVSGNKMDTLSRYKYAIVIENSADFVSEKLFDCISAGCLVLYVGPNLDEFNIRDHELFLCSADIDEVANTALKILGLNQSEQYAIAKSQNSAFCRISKDWENSNVLGLLAQDILKDLNQGSN